VFKHFSGAIDASTTTAKELLHRIQNNVKEELVTGEHVYTEDRDIP
jgi:hypothetical protein